MPWRNLHSCSSLISPTSRKEIYIHLKNDFWAIFGTLNFYIFLQIRNDILAVFTLFLYRKCLQIFLKALNAVSSKLFVIGTKCSLNSFLLVDQKIFFSWIFTSDSFGALKAVVFYFNTFLNCLIKTNFICEEGRWKENHQIQIP